MRRYLWRYTHTPGGDTSALWFSESVRYSTARSLALSPLSLPPPTPTTSRHTGSIQSNDSVHTHTRTHARTHTRLILQVSPLQEDSDTSKCPSVHRVDVSLQVEEPGLVNPLVIPMQPVNLTSLMTLKRDWV